MRSRQTKNPPSGIEDSRERLLRAAKQVFAQRGFGGATLREIVNQSKVNLAMVSYHFGGKQGLFDACLMDFGRDRLVATEKALQPCRSAEELRVRLQMFVEGVIDSYLSEPELTLLIHQECETNAKGFEKIFRATFYKIFETFVGFLKAGQLKQLVRNDIETLLIAKHIFAMLVHATRSDAVTQFYIGYGLKDLKYRKSVVESLVEIAISGSSSRKGER